MMTRPVTADPRAELVDWDVIDLTELSPVDEWSDEDWEDAVLGTLAAESQRRRASGLDGPGIEFGEYLKSRGIELNR